MNPFADQAAFMQACGQSIDQFNPRQANLYAELIREEHEEFKVDPETGVVKRRHDGKILKPNGWTPPNLRAIIEE